MRTLLVCVCARVCVCVCVYKRMIEAVIVVVLYGELEDCGIGQGSDVIRMYLCCVVHRE